MKSATSPTIQDRCRGTEWANDCQKLENIKKQQIENLCRTWNFWTGNFEHAHTHFLLHFLQIIIMEVDVYLLKLFSDLLPQLPEHTPDSL